MFLSSKNSGLDTVILNPKPNPESKSNPESKPNPESKSNPETEKVVI
jgi:hypothetical protein